jgi:pimeloyl-ACP methyl ester carboxylesterase
MVFVHGAFGDAETTWKAANGAYWPNLLIDDSDFDNIDILVVSYPTGFWTTLTVDELAESLRATLTVNRIDAYRKIIFVVHSMGGLVTRAYLLKNREVADRTWFAYFYSTPTTGSQIASIVDRIAKHDQISKLRLLTSDDYLADLMRQWLAAAFQFPSYCAYEKRLTQGIALVVNMDSAAALCTKALDPIDADHTSIVKPENRSSAPYVVLKAAFLDAKLKDVNRKNGPANNRLTGELVEVFRFPITQKRIVGTTYIEKYAPNKTPLRVFLTLNNYNRDEIIQAAQIGADLDNFKTLYYNFLTSVSNWQREAAKQISSWLGTEEHTEKTLEYCVWLLMKRSREDLPENFPRRNIFYYERACEGLTRQDTPWQNKKLDVNGFATLLQTWDDLNRQVTDLSIRILN